VAAGYETEDRSKRAKRSSVVSVRVYLCVCKKKTKGYYVRMCPYVYVCVRVSVRACVRGCANACTCTYIS
jgi:hypothetical protein